MTLIPKLQSAGISLTCSHFCVSMVRSNSCPYKPIWVRKPVLHSNTTCFKLTDLKGLSRPVTVNVTHQKADRGNASELLQQLQMQV